MPFTVEQFLNVFVVYNTVIWPMQFGLVAIAMFVILTAFKPGKRSSRLITVLLSFLWFWAGIVYHLGFFRHINEIATIFGALFIIQAVLLLYVGVIRGDLRYQPRLDLSGVVGAFLVLYAIIVYPELAYVTGHKYPGAPTFGTPCPLTVFTFGILLWADGLARWFLLGIPLLWSLTGVAAVWHLGMLEDILLPLGGLISFSVIMWHSRHRQESNSSSLGGFQRLVDPEGPPNSRGARVGT